jgi:ABC-type Mn2+/Zn2+ transport system permease subunit
VSGYLTDLVDINGLPLLACLAVSGILVYLGMHVVERKVIFVDLALAQIAAFGVMWAILMGYSHEDDHVAVTLYSLAFTVLGAAIFSITRTRNERVPHEALIGIIYVTATAGGLVLADRFALGTEALKELIAGRVALVTSDILIKLVLTCVAVGVAFAALHRRFIRISRDPAAAEASGMKIRLWDFIFYLLFGVLITQSVSVLGVLPVFAYLVIPAVAAAFLFESVLARLLFGWAFASLISLGGLETARLSQLDPGPTIVCLFAAALVLLGAFLYLRYRTFSLRAIAQVAGFTLLFSGFLAATLLFRKSHPTDEYATAMEFARSGEINRMRQAMVSFEKFPDRKEQWVPVVTDMLSHSDRVAREEAAVLLGKVHATGAVPALLARLDPAKETEDSVRELAVTALRTIGDHDTVDPLAAAAATEEEPDIAVQMCAAVIDLADTHHPDARQKCLDLAARIAADESAPNAARREAAQLGGHALPP